MQLIAFHSASCNV